jgi:hypothetical protein
MSIEMLLPKIACIQSIQSADDFRCLVRLIVGMEIVYHPDDDFSDYIDYTTRLPLFDADTTRHLNQLHEQAFHLLGDEAYEIALLEAFPKEQN